MGRRTKIHLAPNLTFSTDIITEVIDILAKRGSGKTYTATKLAEEMLIVGAQIVAIDPVGNWYGLRLGADGRPKGGMDIVILGGRHGDIPLEATAGQLVAKTVVETGMSVILDVSLLSKPKQRRFVTEFSEALLEYRKRDPAAMHIFWEEAYRFMPQKLAKGAKAEMLEATEELVTMGRNFGIGGTIICLRSALVSKNVLTQASILVAMHTTGLADRTSIKAWIDYNKLEEVNLDLAELKKGEAFVWWPEEFGIKRIKVDRKTTYDASATPKFGQKARHRKLRGVDLEALQGAMADTIEKIKGEDPRILKRTIVDLKRALTHEQDRVSEVERALTDLHGRDRVAEVEVPVRVEVPVISPADLKTVTGIVVETKDGMRTLGDAIGGLEKQLSLVHGFKDQPLKSTNGKSKAGTFPVRMSSVKTTGPAPVLTMTEDLKITAGALRMLKALAAMSPGGLTRKQVAMVARMKSKSGTFGNYWSKLNVAGFLRQHGSQWFITDPGMAFLGDDVPVQPDTPQEKLNFWCERLNSKAQEMLRFMFKHPDMTFSKLDIAEEVKLIHTSGTFGNYLSRLTSNNLAVRTDGGYKVSPELMA